MFLKLAISVSIFVFWSSHWNGERTTDFMWEFEDNPPDLTQQKPFVEGPFHYVFMVRLLCLMKSGEVCNLLGFHTNSFVEEPLLKKSLRSGSLWARQTDKGWGRQVRGGVQNEREAGHNAKCRRGGATGSPGHFNLWIHCFPLCHWSLILCNEACWSQ